jgi:hypothetical protein
VYEYLYYERVLIAEHTDINDEAQTVMIAESEEPEEPKESKEPKESEEPKEIELTDPSPILAFKEFDTELFTKDLPAPLFIVTVPESISLTGGDNKLPITVSDMQGTLSQAVVVSFEGTQEPEAPGQQFILRNPEAAIRGYDGAFYYALSDYSGMSLRDSSRSIGAPVAVFKSDGTCSLHITPADPMKSNLMPSSPYTGHITFGIRLEET